MPYNSTLLSYSIQAHRACISQYLCLFYTHVRSTSLRPHSSCWESRAIYQCSPLDRSIRLDKLGLSFLVRGSCQGTSQSGIPTQQDMGVVWMTSHNIGSIHKK